MRQPLRARASGQAVLGARPGGRRTRRSTPAASRAALRSGGRRGLRSRLLAVSGAGDGEAAARAEVRERGQLCTAGTACERRPVRGDVEQLLDLFDARVEVEQLRAALAHEPFVEAVVTEHLVD